MWPALRTSTLSRTFVARLGLSRTRSQLSMCMRCRQGRDDLSMDVLLDAMQTFEARKVLERDASPHAVLRLSKCDAAEKGRSICTLCWLCSSTFA